MEEWKINMENNEVVVALGAESAGNFSIYKNGIVYFSEDFGDLLDDQNFKKYQKELSNFLTKNKIRPTVILSDLHPLFRTTVLAKQFAKKYKANHIPVQHHIAHIFSAIGDHIVELGTRNVKRNVIGIACDGTGYADDGSIWGGEIFSIQHAECNIQNTRIGHLENQILIGGEKAISEPARVLMAILSKFLDKSIVNSHVKKFYTKNEFEVLYSQLQQNFNCIETSSTARILDAVSVLLGFSKNERLSKHGPVQLLEQNSTKPFNNLKPKIEYKVIGHRSLASLNTTYLFEYLIKNNPPAGGKDKKRLAATAQKYIADGLVEMIKNLQPATCNLQPVFFAGGMANNKIISSILKKQGVYISKKIPPGDAGISVGQLFYYLFNEK
ncbi:MAG: hypothetical protein ACD_56C00128G0003 [uncultured bacterium]|nr:MAG: hypothetical protein ACD_56C00128G0003 [uncultured bacterium]